MARLARVVLPGVPHHVTQRGNGRAQCFFSDQDYELYRDLLVEHCDRCDIDILGWCLMPNHVHLILTPQDSDGLRRALSKTHRAYAGHVNKREARTGHFWQGRFGCVAMDEAHLVAAMAYVALNPVRARLVTRVEEWRWSAIHGYRHRQRRDGVLAPERVRPFVKPAMVMIRKGAGLDGEEDERFTRLRQAESIGRPVGDSEFLTAAEAVTGRTLKPAKRGPKPGAEDGSEQ